MGVIQVVILSALVYGSMSVLEWHSKRRLRQLRNRPSLDLVTTKHNFSIPKPWVKAAEKIARETRLPPDEPPLDIGDQCLFLDGVTFRGVGIMTVVEADEERVIVAWDEGHQEHGIPRAIVRRYKPDSGSRKREKPKQLLEA